VLAVENRVAVRGSGGLGQRLRSSPGLLLCGVLITATLLLVLRPPWTMTDLAVYRRGAGELLHRQSLYVDLPTFPFTYPPFAALCFVPLYLIGRAPAIVVGTAVSLLAYAGTIDLLGRRLALSTTQIRLFLVGGLCFEPIWHTLALGQVNLYLAALVTVDAFVLPARHRGWLVGLAAGIKLVPGVFVLYFLLQRNWRAVLQSAAGLLGTIVVGWLAAPADSTKYWTKLFFSTDHVRGVAYVGNQSLNGGLVRLTRNEHPPTGWYVALAVCAVALGALAARRQLRAGRDAAAFVCIAMVGLLVSPISWTHHWVWLVPAVMVLAAGRHWIGAAAVTAVGVIAPMWFTPATDLREFHHSWWQAALCLSYAAAAVWFLARLAAEPAGPRPRPAAAQAQPV